MRERIAYVVAASALLLVGAGCGGAVKEEASVDIGAPSGEESMMKKDEGTMMKAEGSVDGSVDLILEGAEAEKMNEAESEKDADEVTADKASINAYGDSSYEIK